MQIEYKSIKLILVLIFKKTTLLYATPWPTLSHEQSPWKYEIKAMW